MKIGRRSLPIVAAVLVASGVIALLGFAVSRPMTGLFHDDGIYVVTAKALAEGHGFRIESLPGTPAQTKYGPVYPAILALVWRAVPRFPENVIPMKLVTAAFLVPWLWLTYVFLRRVLAVSPLAGAWICIITAGLPWTVKCAGTLLSELPFAALATRMPRWAG